MPRPNKDGLDYFPLDVDIDHDDKIEPIEAAHNLIGFGVVIKLLMKIYKNGYYYQWSEREQLLFSKRNNVDINLLNAIINDCIKWGVFDKALFEKYQILTSRGIQKRYFQAISRRKDIKVYKEYIVDITTIDANLAEKIKFINVNINSINHDNNSQSKVKESKVKESKERSPVRSPVFNSREEIYKLHSRYTAEQIKIIDRYWDIIKFTRKNGKISFGIIATEMDYWEQFPVDIVIESIATHIEKYQTKRENYTRGIMRGKKREREAMKNGKTRHNFGTNQNELDKIDWSKFDAKPVSEPVSEPI